MTQVTQYQNDDDGFSGSLVGGRLIRGHLLRWNETNGWMDRDGLKPPEILLAVAVDEALQPWKNKKPGEPITAKPLPDVDDLNSAIPISEWEPGLDGKPKPPWVHQYIVYLIDPASGGFFTYLNYTYGAMLAYEDLRERVITMRALRGARVVPEVRLGDAPMKTGYGMKRRPDFPGVGWRMLGAAVGAAQTPQLASPASAAEETLATLGEVKEVTAKEFVDDEIPY